MSGKAKNAALFPKCGESGRKALLLTLVSLLFLVLGASTVSLQTGPAEELRKQELLRGIWIRRGFVYTFQDSLALRVTRTGNGETIHGRYSWFRMGVHDCIALRKDGVDTPVEVLLIGEVTDSTAVIALGAPFVRADSSRGLPGLWKHLDRMERIEWRFGADTAEYRRTVYNPENGQGRVTEAYRGKYQRVDNRGEPGQFIVWFGGGKQAIVLPVIYRDMMYLFDLTPGTAFFTRYRPLTAPIAGLHAGE